DLEDAIAPLQPSEAPRQIQMTAPVLLVEDILPPQLCRQLIQTHDRGKTFASGMARVIEGKPVLQQDANLKKRIDHIVEDRDLTTTLTDLLSRRLLPEMKKAFHFQPRGLENFKIVRYDSTSQGFFSLHRDNNSKDTARRKFALTLNLNSPAAYKGGALRFPEYGPDLYRPQAGQALVFSCSHLHEVTPVTQGTRYVLINFFLV
ncbi:MAG: 2OG-Fe(II) oxygenase, partial [Cyanobacteria bacterium P01_F01_bin.4]